MITVRRSFERGLTDLDWLQSHHSFSFGGYYDPKFMGFESLRVVNEDFLDPGAGFPEHHHANMEIFSYVVRGALEHKDNLGNQTIIPQHHFQKISAGSGILHSEYNPNPHEPVHFIQIWIIPNALNTVPSYEQKVFPLASRQGRLQLIAAERSNEEIIKVQQSVNIYLGAFDGQESVQHPLKENQRSWLYVVRGSLFLNGFVLEQGDSAEIHKEPLVILNQGVDAEILLFDFLHPTWK